MSSNNVDTVQEIYDAFVRADVQSILAVVTDDVDWASEAASTLAPWHGIRRGKAEVAKFFTDIAGAVDVTEFTLLAIASNDTDVMAVIRFGITSKPPGAAVPWTCTTGGGSATERSTCTAGRKTPH